VFTAREALAVGYDVDGIKGELRRKRWIRLRKGVYASAEAVARADARMRHLMNCAAVLLVLADGPVLSHASAARLHGLVVPGSAGWDVRVTTSGQWRVGRGYRVAQAALPDGDVVPWISFGATSIPRTLVDCAREWSQIDAVIALDAALQAELVRRAEVQAAVLAARHRAGASAAARALGLADGRAESPLETKGRLRFLTAGLPLPELQVDLYDGRGYVGRLDAWFEDAAVAVEFDGFQKYADPWGDRTPAQVAWDEKRREDRVRATGIRVVRVVNEDFGAPWADVVTRLRTLLATPFAGPRRFRVVRRPEPGAAADAA
jgi:predicted transcriptional regulator of viral defense system